MANDGIRRRLAAILAADVVGYSRMMEADEAGTLTALRAVWDATFNPLVARHNGRVVKMMGDGALVEFGSAVDAVSCAVAIQRALAERAASPSGGPGIAFRIGVNLGDIVIQDDDILGDGVNVAARLEGAAPEGGVLVSDLVHSQVAGKVDVTFDDAGELTLKNIDRPLRAWSWGGEGAATRQAAPPSAAARPESVAAEQSIRFCMAPDGVQIAYAVSGSGPPLVKAPNWMTHLEFEWQSPVWRHMIEELSSQHTLVRFDQRGNGLSDWDVETISFDAFLGDLETVIEAAKLERFPLFGVSQGCSLSIAYAVRHPERVSHLVLYGGFARGHYKRGQAAKEQAEAMVTLIRHGWGQDNPAFRQMFTSAFVPGGTQEQMEWFNELQRISISAENAARLRDAVGHFDVTHLLGQVSVPTLILHCRDDAVSPFNEGRRMAAMIPDAKFVSLEGQNHLILEHEPAWPRFVAEVRKFLGTAE